jgi:uncharacterized protein (DUF1330 family)
MRRIGSIGLVLAGAAIGAAAEHGLHAQTKGPGAYFIADVAEVTNPAGMRSAVEKMAPFIASAGGHFVAQTQNITAVHGTPPKRIAIIAFDSVAAAKAFAEGANIKDVQAEIDKNSKQTRFIVEGM